MQSAASSSAAPPVGDDAFDAPHYSYAECGSSFYGLAGGVHSGFEASSSAAAAGPGSDGKKRTRASARNSGSSSSGYPLQISDRPLSPSLSSAHQHKRSRSDRDVSSSVADAQPQHAQYQSLAVTASADGDDSSSISGGGDALVYRTVALGQAAGIAGPFPVTVTGAQGDLPSSIVITSVPMGPLAPALALYEHSGATSADASAAPVHAAAHSVSHRACSGSIGHTSSIHIRPAVLQELRTVAPRDLSTLTQALAALEASGANIESFIGHLGHEPTGSGGGGTKKKGRGAGSGDGTERLDTVTAADSNLVGTFVDGTLLSSAWAEGDDDDRVAAGPRDNDGGASLASPPPAARGRRGTRGRARSSRRVRDHEEPVVPAAAPSSSVCFTQPVISSTRIPSYVPAELTSIDPSTGRLPARAVAEFLESLDEAEPVPTRRGKRDNSGGSRGTNGSGGRSASPGAGGSGGGGGGGRTSPLGVHAHSAPQVEVINPLCVRATSLLESAAGGATRASGPGLRSKGRRKAAIAVADSAETDGQFEEGAWTPVEEGPHYDAYGGLYESFGAEEPSDYGAEQPQQSRQQEAREGTGSPVEWAEYTAPPLTSDSTGSIPRGRHGRPSRAPTHDDDFVYDLDAGGAAAAAAAAAGHWDGAAEVVSASALASSNGVSTGSHEASQAARSASSRGRAGQGRQADGVIPSTNNIVSLSHSRGRSGRGRGFASRSRGARRGGLGRAAARAAGGGERRRDSQPPQQQRPADMHVSDIEDSGSDADKAAPQHQVQQPQRANGSGSADGRSNGTALNGASASSVGGSAGLFDGGAVFSARLGGLLPLQLASSNFESGDLPTAAAAGSSSLDSDPLGFRSYYQKRSALGLSTAAEIEAGIVPSNLPLYTLPTPENREAGNGGGGGLGVGHYTVDITAAAEATASHLPFMQPQREGGGEEAHVYSLLSATAAGVGLGEASLYSFEASGQSGLPLSSSSSKLISPSTFLRAANES